MPHNDSMPEIIYIMGTARSGSTVLQIVLAASPGILAAGEVTHIFQDGFLDDAVCACGKNTADCTVWGEVGRLTAWGRSELEKLARMVRSLESHANFPRMVLGLFSGRAKRRYREVNEALFANLSRVSGAHTIVDASKYAGRALALSRAFRGKVWVIALTRSPEGILSAFRKGHREEQKPKSLAGAMLYYLYVATATRLTAAILGQRAICIGFEQLAADPAGTLARIERWCGKDLSAARARLAGQESFDTGHIVTGNRLRKAGTVRFDPSVAEIDSPHGAARIALATMNLYRSLLNL
ncbi:MAG: sulfotransferase [SAR324 cluster bacterium]|nr:sulfotransferase [SAR324 cluster bacterium]